MIKVGVFWVAAFLGVDIIFDIEEYPDDYQAKDMIITYSKQHKDVWERLSKVQCAGKYSTYKFDALPRGRVWYDLEEKIYAVAAGLSALSSWICSTGIGTILWGLFSLSSVYVAIKAISAVSQGKGLMLSIEWAKIWFIKVPCGLNLDVR